MDIFFIIFISSSATAAVLGREGGLGDRGGGGLGIIAVGTPVGFYNIIFLMIILLF